MNYQILAIVLLAIAVAALLYLIVRMTRLQKAVSELNGRHQDALKSETRTLFHQLEAYNFVRDRLDLHEGLPYTWDWSASPDFLKIITEHCLEEKPAVIVECSSGLTSLVLARCCKMNGDGRVVSLENGEEYAEKTQQHIARYGLQQHAEVLHAPLKDVTINGSVYQWYALDDLQDESIDMLVIDGPPGFIQKHSRYPAIPLLFDKLADGCVIFMDDAQRADEREIVEMWQGEHHMLNHKYIKTQRGCSMLKLHKG
ncbi:MAG: class I SAM-dependent methyltransferase [Candidatus Sedimenticola sp. PURPLELP]